MKKNYLSVCIFLLTLVLPVLLLAVSDGPRKGAIGPGGVVVLETKRTDQGYSSQYGRPTKRAIDAVVQVARNSQKIAGVLA